jgi:hypothetical protein
MSSNRVPGGVALAADESTLVVDRFMYSTVAFHLHTELALTNRRFIAARPSTLAGLIPVGTSRASYPIENIAGVNAGTRFEILGVLVGFLVGIIGLWALSVPQAQAAGLLLIILGAVVVVSAPKQFVEVMNSGGGTIRFPVSVFERDRTLEFANRVSEAIAGSLKGARASQEYTRPTAASTDPSGALRQLEQLRSQGLITDTEFAAKRQDILNRL